ncbi:MAG TPA: type II secretion system F family protein [Planctomycetaceae bacterium]|nr:type II secretion system F family protein [Planctomycetaceae bacterium]
MFPVWLRLTLYIAATFAGVWLLFRLWQARRASKPYEPRRQREPMPPRPAPVATPLAAMATSVVSPPTSASALQPVASSGQAARSDTSSWDQHTLFGRQREDNRLPRVLVEDLPIARQDDLAFGALTPAFASLMPESETRQEEARRELQSAGFYAPHALQNFAASRYLLMMAGLIAAGVALLLVPQEFEWIAVTGLIALPLLGWAVPRLYVRGKAADRRSEIERGMPDLLDMLNMCVSQGLTIPDALKRILPDLRGPYPALAQELRIVTEQAAIGTMPVALENFSRRIDIPEVHSFSSLLTQTERMGTSISEALVSYSDTMRESLQQRADEKGNRATFKLLFPTVLCLMPAVYLFLLGPAIIELSNFFYSGGRDALDQGSAVIERINQQRAQGPFRDAAP